MSGRIQTPPFGYLSALGLKSSGENPKETSVNLDNVYVTNNFYDTTLLTTFSNGLATAQVVGDLVAAQVPAGNAWRLLGIQCAFGPLGAGDDCRISVGVQWRGNSIRIASTNFILNAAAGDSASWGFTVPADIILLAGAAVFAVLDQATVAAQHTLSIGGLVVEYEV